VIQDSDGFSARLNVVARADADNLDKGSVSAWGADILVGLLVGRTFLSAC